MKYTSIALAALLAGCATEPDSLDLDLETNRSLLMGSDSATIEAIPGTGELLLRGVMTLPSSCFGIAATATRDRFGLVVELRAVQERGACFDVVIRYDYTGAIRNIPAGRYRVIVNHIRNNEVEQAGTAMVTFP